MLPKAVAAAGSWASEAAVVMAVIAVDNDITCLAVSLTMQHGAEPAARAAIAVAAARSSAFEVAVVMAVIAVTSDITCLAACQRHCSNKIISNA